MGIQIVFETHSISADNEHGIATGWHDGQLSRAGGLWLASSACDDATMASGRSSPRILDAPSKRHESRSDKHPSQLLRGLALRECDYGALNGQPAADLHRDRLRYLDMPYPDGESWRQAIQRVGRFLTDLPLRWANARVLVIGHVATRWALDHLLDGMALEDLIAADFAWRAGSGIPDA